MLTSINKNYSHVIKCRATITCRNYMLSNGLLCVIEDNIYSILHNYDFSIQAPDIGITENIYLLYQYPTMVLIQCGSIITYISWEKLK